MKDEIIGIAEAWNAGFIDEAERVSEPREHLWASELGNSPIDLFLRLKGVKPSNPPNDRAKRKMGAGVDWEHQIKRIFERSGILLDTQTRCEYQYDGLMKVTGKLDFLIGGKADEMKAATYLTLSADLPPNWKRAAENAVKYYQTKYPEGFTPMPVEFKSISDYAMDEMEKSRKPVKRHRLQIYHYLKSLGYPKATLSYMNRNDCRMIEFTIQETPELEAEYRAAIEGISKYYLNNETPPKEKFLIFSEEHGKFTKNLNVSWSNYLTHLYGFKEPREYDEPFGKKAGNWNRVLTRVKNGAKMTPKNEDILREIEAEGYNLEDIVSKLTPEAAEEEAV